MNFPEELLQMMRRAGHVAVLTGAGISAESGVPTFREAQRGLWAKYDPQQLATPQAFRRDPQLVWAWYTWRRELVASVEPNPAHLALVEMAEQAPLFTLVTQNVDSLHHRAGSKDVLELHGNIMRTKCFNCGRMADEQDLISGISGSRLPTCSACGGYLRPDVVWFGEPLPRDALERALLAARDCDLFFSIGTSALVQPAASLPAEALARDCPVVEINPQATPLTPYVTFTLNGPAGEILPELVAAAWGSGASS